MSTIRWGAWLVGVAMVVGWSGSVMAAGPTPAQRCEAAKNQAAGVKAQCLAKERASEVEGRTPNFAKCETNFTKAFAAAERKAGPGVCPTEGDTAAIEAMVDTCMADIASALAGSPPPPPCPSSKLPATGQTTCWDSTGTVIACAGTGQDGDIKAGAVLSYTDNGDGTITDNNTGLVWEKKSDDGSINDYQNVYVWTDAFTTFIATLNTAPCFAGYCDWRLPSVNELRSIVNYENFNPAVSPVFNTACAEGCTVTGCSCTPGFRVWSSSTWAFFGHWAWSVNFGDGEVSGFQKNNVLPVRAVRGVL